MRKIIALLIISALLTTACSKNDDTSIDKYLEQGKIALANEEYDKALKFFNLAKEEKSNNEEVNFLWTQTNNLIEAFESKESKHYSVAIQLCETIESIDSETNIVKDSAKKLKEECLKLMNEDETPDDNTSVEDNELKQDNINNQAEQVSTKKSYLDLLSSIQSEVNELEKNDEYIGTTVGMESLGSISYEKWDNALNKIYGELKNQLPQNEMESLKVAQRSWVKYRDKQAQMAADEYKGGSLSSVEYAFTLANLTKERCYELINKYMR